MHILDLLGTLAFAITGAYKAKLRELNIFGVLLLGSMTAVGGGTVRDAVMGRVPLFFLQDPAYLIIATAGGIATYFSPVFFKRAYSLFRFLDSLGLAAFVVIGVSITRDQLFPHLVSPSLPSLLSCVFLGMLTGFGGGIVRDAVMGDTPYSLKRGSNYAASAFVGASIFYVGMFSNVPVSVVLSMASTLILREVVSPFGFWRRVWKQSSQSSANI